MSEVTTQALVGFDIALTLYVLGQVTGEVVFYTLVALVAGALALVLGVGEDDD